MTDSTCVPPGQEGMTSARSQACSSPPPWHFFVPAQEEQAVRDAVFMQMRREGLLGCAMSSTLRPNLRLWRRLTHPERAWLVVCASGEQRLGAALLTPWRGQVWEFDFTCFRKGMPWAVPMARQVLAWIFAHAPVRVLWGLCPVPNAHAWRLAERAGFRRAGLVPEACWWARRQCYVDGVLLWVEKETFVE